MDWFIDLIRSLFFFLDSIVYPLIAMVYNLFVDIANTTVFSEDVINMFAEKVYALLGVFMLFKVSFSIMTYIVNPDEFTDKTKGFSKMISNVVITLALLLLTPWIFSEAMDIQRIVLKDNIIGKIFATSETSNVSIIDAGNTMSYETFKAFYYLDTDLHTNCNGIYNQQNTDGNTLSGCSSTFPNYDKYKDLFYISETSKSVDAYTRDFDLLNEKSSNEEYVMTYMPLISTIAGGFICWILIVFCFDVATRSIKLGFLRMIAPIPIISRIDPKKGKEVFDKWVKSCVGTYLDLFIRLLAIYFAVYVIGLVANMEFVDTVTGAETNVNAFVKVFIILGALLFAKQLPKLLQELIPGLKLDGKFTLNPLKKMSEVPLVGNAASRALGATGSMMAGQGFKTGWRAGGKAVPLMGGDGKQSIAAGFNRYNRFGEDGKKRSEENQKYELGEKLFKQYGEKASGNASIYKGANAEKYAQSARLMNDAKDRKNELEGDYRQLEMFFNTNKDKMSTEEQNKYIKLIDKARVDAAKAASDYDKLKTAHNYLRSQDGVNAAREDAYVAAEDRHTAATKVNEYNRSNYDFNALASKINAQSSTTNSTININSSTDANSAVNVNNNSDVKENIRWNSTTGEFYTPDKNEHDIQQLKYETMFNLNSVNEKVDHVEQQVDYEQFFSSPQVQEQITKNEKRYEDEYNKFFNSPDAQEAIRHNERQSDYNECFNRENVQKEINVNERKLDDRDLPNTKGLDSDSTNNSEW